MPQLSLSSQSQDAFIGLIELHERSWGDEQYTGRPTLAQLLKAPIVAVWSGRGELVTDRQGRVVRTPANNKDGQFLLTCYNTPEELNMALTELVLFRKTTPYAMRKLAKVYIDQKEAEIAGVRLVLKTK